MGVAFWLSSSFARFLVVLLAGMVCGLGVWFGTILIASWFHDRRQREKSEKPNTVLDRGHDGP
jgi:hypothetical protein